MQVKRTEWNISVRERKNQHTIFMYPVNLSFKIKGEIKAFSEKQKLRKFVASRHDLQEMLKNRLFRKEYNMVRNMDLHKKIKRIRWRKSEGKTKMYFSYS